MASALLGLRPVAAHVYNHSGRTIAEMRVVGKWKGRRSAKRRPHMYIATDGLVSFGLGRHDDPRTSAMVSKMGVWPKKLTIAVAGKCIPFEMRACPRFVVSAEVRLAFTS